MSGSLPFPLITMLQYSLSVVKPVEIEQIGQREMSPFTTHATNRNHQRGTFFDLIISTAEIILLDKIHSFLY